MFIQMVHIYNITVGVHRTEPLGALAISGKLLQVTWDIFTASGSFTVFGQQLLEGVETYSAPSHSEYWGWR